MTLQLQEDRGGTTLADTTVTATNKLSFIDSLHFTTAEEKISLLDFVSATAASSLAIGGGPAGKNAVTNIKLYTASGNTTLAGFNRLEIQASGNILLNGDGADSDFEWLQSGSARGLFLEGSTGKLSLTSGTGINEFSIDGTLAGDSDDAVPTEKAIKTYVDTQLTAEDLDFAGDSGTGAVDLDSQSLTIAGTANEISTSAAAQTLTIGLPTDVTIQGALTINPSSADKDVTINWDTGVALFTEGSSGRVMVGGVAPEGRLHILGSDSSIMERTATTGTGAAFILNLKKTTSFASMDNTFGTAQASVIEDSAGVANTITLFNSLRHDADDSGQFQWRTYLTGTPRTHYTLDSLGKETHNISTTATGDLQWLKENGDSMLFVKVANSGGGVGVGTDTPDYFGGAVNPLRVHGGTSSGGLLLTTSDPIAENDRIGSINYVNTLVTGGSGQMVTLNAQIDGAHATNPGSRLETFTKANNGALSLQQRLDEAGKFTHNVSGVAGGDFEFLNSSSAVIAFSDADDDALHFNDDMEIQLGSAAGGDYRIFYDLSETSLIYEPLDATNRRQVFIVGGLGTSAMILTESLLDATNKASRLSFGHYNYQTEEPIAVLNLNNTSTTSTVAIGGNSGSHNAMTDIMFYVAADNTTLGGTQIMSIDIDRVEMDSQKPFKMANMTNTQRDALSAENGDMIYSTTDNAIEAFENGSWVNI